MSFIYGAGLVNNDMALHDTKNKGSTRPLAKNDIFALGEVESVIPGASGEIYDLWALEDLYFDSSLYQGEEENPDTVLNDKYALLSWLCGQVALSPAGMKMLNEAMEEGWSMGLEDLNGPDFHLDVPDRLIVLDNGGMVISALGRSEYFRHILLVSFIRALRDVWQEKRHGGFDELYAPADILMLERVRAADLDVLAVMVAWEIRGEGYGGLWRHMVGSEDGDIAMRYAAYIERDPSSMFNGHALAAAFVQWYRNPARIDLCEHEVLNDLDSLIVERQGMDPVFGCEKLTAIKIESLSCLPDKTAYLHYKGRDIMRDPTFAGMTSMVNQAHLMQILHDMNTVRVHGVPFRDPALAALIFPNGEFTAEDEGVLDF